MFTQVAVDVHNLCGKRARPAGLKAGRRPEGGGKLNVVNSRKTCCHKVCNACVTVSDACLQRKNFFFSNHKCFPNKSGRKHPDTCAALKARMT